MRRGSRSSAPPAATTERLASGMARVAPFAATIRPHASATPTPPATAKPSIAAISGLREDRCAIPAEPRSPNQGESPFTNSPRSMRHQQYPPPTAGTRRGAYCLSLLGAIQRDELDVSAPLGAVGLGRDGCLLGAHRQRR